MDDGDPREEIVDLEARIEELAQAIESCAKVIQLSRVAIAIGAVLFLATMFGAIRFDPLVMISAIAALIGGVVFLGSNKSTSDAATAALKAAELRRAELIGIIDLRIVGD
jgi:hypoxanthine-guanine phosphoribosyltransferase